MTDIGTILNACELVWRQQSISRSSISEMRRELESHLLEAEREGKPAESVVGSDIDRFARTWAGANPMHVVPESLTETRAERSAEAERTRTRMLASIAAIVGVTALGLALGPKSSFEGVEAWQWTFVVATFSLLIGEVITGGFFVLPFGIAAGATSLLAFAEVEPPVLITVFILVSVLATWGLREFASKDDDVIIPVGANRYVDQTAVVTEPINGVGTVGRVRLETESWSAITDGNQHIQAGAVVRVSEVRGARLVVTGV